MTAQPEALRLAALLDAHQFDEPHAAAAELRRLHAELERCKQVCAATAEGWRVERDALLEALRWIDRGAAQSLTGQMLSLTESTLKWRMTPERVPAPPSRRWRKQND
jgi:hypothetical protein